MKNNEYKITCEETAIDRILRNICLYIDVWEMSTTDRVNFLTGYITACHESGEITETNVKSLFELIDNIF
jgi:hypothetical protein